MPDSSEVTIEAGKENSKKCGVNLNNPASDSRSRSHNKGIALNPKRQGSLTEPCSNQMDAVKAPLLTFVKNCVTMEVTVSASL